MDMTNTPSTTWIENLALEELNMDESGIVHLGDFSAKNTHMMLEESSIDFMDQVRDRFEIYVTRFNEYRGGSGAGANIKLFKISNTVNDFMLFRNSVRLIFSRKASDLITITNQVNGGDVYQGSNTLHEIKAQIGPFGKITWRFQGEEVDIDALVRHYLSEFVKISIR
jgi:hypothetical protein